MINKSELKDWLDESARKKYGIKLEEFIDREIKRNALGGSKTFHICTGKYTREGSRNTPFYDLWYTEELSEENRRIVHKKIISSYREFGFNVEETSVDCGWNNRYFALKFNEIDKAVSEN